MWNTFSEVVSTGLDTLMPEKEYRVCAADAPWMTPGLKSVILKRQKAFKNHGPESVQFKYFRKVCRGRFYDSKVKQLKGENPNKWWDEAKRLSGVKVKFGDLIREINIVQANRINSAF